MGADENELPPSEIQREAPQPDPARAALVSDWQKRILRAKKFHGKVFDSMRADMDFAGGKQWVDQADDDERYVANFVQRHIQQRTASLYAKNPRFYFKRKRKLDFSVWDGRMQTLQDAMQTIAGIKHTLAADPSVMANPQLVQAGMMQAQPAMALIQDIEQGMQRQQMLDRIGKTLEILAEHEIGEQKPPFKKQMKQLVRRTLACRVGYLKVGFERVTERRPEDVEKIRDYTQRLAKLQQLIDDARDGECSEEMAQYEEMRQMLDEVKNSPEQIVREGLVFDFPPSASIIIDPNCRQLQGFIGARWIAQEFALDVDDVKQTYGVDLKAAGFMNYVDADTRRTDYSGVLSWTGHTEDRGRVEGQKSKCLVWEIKDKETGMVFTIADGYPDYLREPEPPSVTLERFWDIFALTFNDLENDRDIYPPSDVGLMRPMQLEWNRSREGLREHRIAARPAMASAAGALDDEDKDKLVRHPANAVIELNALGPNQKIEDVLQAIKKPGIDPNLYVTDHLGADRQLVTGAQDANLGMVSGGTATESSIAEGSRMTSVGSNVDDLDDFLAEVGQAIGHVLLHNMSAETVKRVVGQGAVWPELSVQEIAEDLMLDVEAGSSGRPNRAAEIANVKELVPLLLQLPGISPDWLAKQIIRRMDDKIDIEEALASGMPPISSLAKMAMTPLGGGAPPTADPASNPAAQGSAGADNAPKPPGSEMPAPGMGDPLAGVREPFRSNMGPPPTG